MPPIDYHSIPVYKQKLTPFRTFLYALLGVLFIVVVTLLFGTRGDDGNASSMQTTTDWQTLAVWLLSIAVCFFTLLFLYKKLNHQIGYMRQFATDNGWKFQARQKVPDLQPLIDYLGFEGGIAQQWYRVYGNYNGQDFVLLLLQGFISGTDLISGRSNTALAYVTLFCSSQPLTVWPNGLPERYDTFRLNGENFLRLNNANAMYRDDVMGLLRLGFGLEAAPSSASFDAATHKV